MTHAYTASVAASESNRCLSVFPGGSNGEFGFPPDLSIAIERGKGTRIWDTAGKRYTDFSMGWGSVLVGHANPHVTASAVAQSALGANFACVNRRSLELAERIISISPVCEQIRYCASGTEATHYCGRIARAFTGKPKILKFEGAYHGSNDLGTTSLFPQSLLSFPEPEPSCDGTTPGAASDILIAPFNDEQITVDLIDKHAEQLAAVIVEPFHRCISPKPGFLEAIRQRCSEQGVLLVFDEVVTGFRLAFGGAQQYYGVVPDLIAYGKALGGGFPIGVFGGPKELMDLVNERRMNRTSYVWSASTLGGNPVSCAAAWAALDHLDRPGVYAHLHDLGQYLRDGLERALLENDEQGFVIGDGPLAQFIFSRQQVTDYRSTHAADRIKARQVLLELVRRGIFLNPMGTKLYLSTEHTTDDVDAFLAAFSETLEFVKTLNR